MVFVSCTLDNSKLNPKPVKKIHTLMQGDVVSVNLIAGQTINAGVINLSFDSDNLYVTYNTTNGWLLDEVHLWIGTSLAQLPKAGNGNPKIGHFPYKASNLGLVNSYGFTIPLNAFGGYESVCEGTYYVAAHAVVKKSNGNGGFVSETAWGQGPRITNKGNWAMYFGFILQCITEEIS